MNQTCYKESNGRCDCNNTSVFNQADEKCKYIYNVNLCIKGYQRVNSRK